MLKNRIIIQGTRNSFVTIYVGEGVPHEDEMFIIYDVRSSAPLPEAIGTEFYSISFSPNGKVFSIYRIVYDSLRFVAVGFLCISVFVPFEAKLDADKIQPLLDQLMAGYLVYAPQEMLGARTEDWGFINEVLERYTETVQATGMVRASSIPMDNKKEAAYIYYREGNLVKYFEDVDRNLYDEYRSVLLLDEKFRVRDSVLLAVKHSDDITYKIDIVNPDYRLDIKVDGSITVMVNGSTDKNQTIVKADQLATIEFSKHYYQFQLPSLGPASYRELARKHPGIVSIDKTMKRIIINNSLSKPAECVITVTFNDGTGVVAGKVIKETIIWESGEKKKSLDGDKLLFRGEEIDQEWVLNTQTDKYEDVESKFVPADQKSNGNIVYISLKEKKTWPKTGSGSVDWTPDLLGSSISGENADAPNVGLQVSQPKRPSFWPDNTKFFLLILVVVLMSGIFYISYLVTRQHPVPITSVQESGIPDNAAAKDTKDIYIAKSTIDHIEQYATGMELLGDSLVSLLSQINKYTSSSDPGKSNIERVRLELQNAMEVRKAINETESKTAIQNAYNIKDLAPGQNELLKLARNNYDAFLQIDDRDKLSLNDIKSKLNELVESRRKSTHTTDSNSEANEKPEKKSTADNPVKSAGSKNGGKDKYLNPDFAKIMISIKSQNDFDNIDQSRLLPEQQKIFENIRSNITVFKDLVSKKKITGYESIKKRFSN